MAGFCTGQSDTAMIATFDAIHSSVPALNIDHNLLPQRDKLNIT